MDILHDKNNEVSAKLTKNLQESIDTIEVLFIDCSDVVKRKFTIGDQNKVDLYIIYIDNLINKEFLEDIIIRKLLVLNDLPKDDQFRFIKEKGLRTVDLSELLTIEEITQAILSGTTVIMVNGYDKAFQLSNQMFPSRGVPESTSEVVVRGSKEGFSELLSTNKVLIRRRIKDTKLKIKPMKVGIRTRTDIAIVYIEDIVENGLVEEIEQRIKSFIIDGIFDSGMLEQLTETTWYSPFPQFQSTERPDKASSALLDGRVVVLVDNSPMALILPTTLSTFFQASDDYYSNWEVVSFTRILRYIAAFLAISLPGLYMTIINYQSEIIPTSLALSFSAARQGVPFSVFFEVILMEMAFELLREAGVRLPGPMGNTIGIVGGIIIGDAAVSANLVSPMIVIITALTAIASFSIPNEAFAEAFRLTRYMIIFFSAFLGLFGFLTGIMLILIHLAGLKSFDIPYLMPFASSSMNADNGAKDTILRFPLFALRKRPIYANKNEKIRLVRKSNNKEIQK